MVHDVAPDTRWVCRLTVDLPDGTVRHGRLLHRLSEEIGRTCAVDVADPGVALAYAPEGSTLEQARDDALGVLTFTLGRLGLAEESVREHVLIPSEELSVWQILSDLRAAGHLDM